MAEHDIQKSFDELLSYVNTKLGSLDRRLTNLEGVEGGGGSGAPTNATYITQTPNASLSAEQALSLLASGILKSATGTGVVSIATAGIDYADVAHTHAIYALTGHTHSANEANTASNQGAGGVGLFISKVGVDLQFKNINTGSTKISVTNDVGNKEVDIDAVEANFNLANLGGTLTASQYVTMIGATGVANGTKGAVPQPLIADQFKFLRGDGTWNTPTAIVDMTQVEIDFGTDPIYSKEFTITDAGVSGTSQIMATMALEAPTGKEVDEIEMDMLKLMCQAGSGQFILYAEALEGRVLGAFKINYLVG